MRLRVLLIIMCLAISMIPVGIIGGIGNFQIAAGFLGLIFIVTFSVAFVMSYFISRPLEKLTRNIDEISKGNLDVELEKSEIVEINTLTDSLDRVMASLKLAIHKVGIKKGEIFEEVMKAKEEVEEKYQDLLDNIEEWAWETDAKGVYVSCSKKVADVLGYTPEEVVGKTIYELMPPDEAKKVKPIFSEYSKKQELIHKLENYYLHKDGYKVCVFTNAIPIFDKDGNFCGYRGVHKDITTHRQSEDKIGELIIKNKKLLEMRKRTRELLNESEDMNGRIMSQEERIEGKRLEKEMDSMFIFDEKARIIDCNKNMYEHLGYTKEEMLSLNIADFDALETQESIKKKIDEIKKQGNIHVKTIHKRKDGSSIFVSENIQYLKDENKFKCIVKEDFA